MARIAPRPVGTYLYGRRMYETRVLWETPDCQISATSCTNGGWSARAGVVYSKTLQTVTSAKTQIERAFDPQAVRQLKAAAAPDLTVGGSELAAQAIEARPVDEYHLFLVPVVGGGGERSIPEQTARVNLELRNERRFRNGTVYLHYRTRT